MKDNSMGRSQLISPPKIDKGFKRLLILVVTQFKTEFLDFELPLKQVDRVFLLWVLDPMIGDSKVVESEGFLGYFVVASVENAVKRDLILFLGLAIFFRCPQIDICVLHRVKLQTARFFL